MAAFAQASLKKKSFPMTNEYVALEETPPKDKHYRKYASGVERALLLFDTALQEWADYISFLSRLLKVRSNLPVIRAICHALPRPCLLNISICAHVGLTSAAVQYHHDPLQGPRRKAPFPMSQPLAPLRCPPESSRGIRLCILCHWERWPLPRPPALPLWPGPDPVVRIPDR